MSGSGIKSESKVPLTKSTWSICSWLFCWNIPLLWLGSRKKLKPENIPRCSPADTTEALVSHLSERWEAEKQKRRPSLGRALIRMFGAKYFQAWALIVFQQSILKPCTPILLGLLIQYLRGIYTTETGYALAGLYVAITFACSVIIHNGQFILLHMGMRIRVSLTSLVYQKSLRLSQASLAETGVGQLSNMISNDVNRFDQFFQYTPAIVSAPVLILFAAVILWSFTGPAGLVGLILYVIILPVQVLLGRQQGKLRSKTAAFSDIRIRLVNEILNGMLLVKMNIWEEPYQQKMEAARSSEMKTIRTRKIRMGINIGVLEAITKFSILLTVVASFLLTNEPLTAEAVFVTISLFNLLEPILAIHFPFGASSLAEILVSITRIQKFLLLEDKVNHSVEVQSRTFHRTTIDTNIKQVQISDFSASWKNTPCLLNVSFEVKSGELLGIVGPVGSGKSSLLLAILRELPPDAGSVSIEGSLAYASQEACHFPGSFKENIIFANSFEPVWYETVIEACALTTDRAALPYGDETLIGDKGINLSGGQKARLGLARAVYSRADIYLLDDPLSAVDTRVARHLMQNCILGLLRDKCVVLVTHQTHFLREATQIVVLDNGKVTCRGSYEQVYADLETEQDLPLVIDDIDIEDGFSNSRVPVSSIPSNGYGTFGKQAAHVETQGQGRIGWDLYWKHIRAGNSPLKILTILMVAILAQFALNGSDFWLKLWTEFEENQQSSSNFSTDASSSAFFQSTNDYMYIYALFVLSILIFSISRVLQIVLAYTSSAVVLYKRMFSSIIRVPMRFFEVNSTGIILNRFTNDTGVIDDVLPQLYYACCGTYLQVLGAIVVVVIQTPIFLLPTAAMLIVFLIVMPIFSRTSSQIKRMESVARSPVFTHLATTLGGLPVIRAFGAEEIQLSKFYSYQDLHSANFYVSISILKWFQSTIELVVNLYISIILLTLVLCSASATVLGLSMSSCVSLGLNFMLGLSQSSNISSLIVAVERVIDYSMVKPEAPLKIPGRDVDPSWLQQGDIRMDHVSVAYETGTEVLRNISFKVDAGEKIGIVGRTGAGKSSLISTLFRIVEPSRGQIHISNMDITKMGLHDLRAQLSIIPQNPILFSGSLRQNLDPFNEFTDSVLWRALEAVKLENRIQVDSDQNLDLLVSDGGSNFSHGEKQLLCLARTILRNSKIVILDEATANIDLRTDSIIQETLRERFREATVLTVAHRLDTVIDCDRILVLDSGCIQEFDEPSNLLRNEDSFLFKLVENTGRANAEKLRESADEAWKKRRRLPTSTLIIGSQK